MKIFFYAKLIFFGSVALAACSHGSVQGLYETDAEATISTELDPLGIGSSPVLFERRISNACPGTEGEEMWHAKLNGINAIKLTYGVRFNGTDTGQRSTLSLDPNFGRERSLFCTGDGVSLDFEPFIVEVKLN